VKYEYIVKEALAEFTAYISSEKGLSPLTVEAYSRDIAAFIAFLSRFAIDDFVSITSDLIVAFLAHMQATGYSSATICRHLIAIKVLFRFLTGEQIVTKNPSSHLESPKLWQLLPEILTAEEIKALLAQPSMSSESGVRDRAILEVLYGAGLRVSEACLLTIYDVTDEFLRTMGKGSQERLVPIGRYALAAIDRYLSLYRCRYDSEKLLTLFLSTRGRPINRVAVWKMVKGYAKKASITKNVSPHSMRHSFATHLLENGADLRVIQELLGHATIASTDRYTQVNRRQLQRSFTAFHPRP